VRAQWSQSERGRRSGKEKFRERERPGVGREKREENAGTGKGMGPMRDGYVRAITTVSLIFPRFMTQNYLLVIIFAFTQHMRKIKRKAKFSIHSKTTIFTQAETTSFWPSF
jgi:hypothetical protein